MEFLHMLTERCVELLEVDAAGLLLAHARGTLQLVAASTEQARVVELFQIQNHEGPCPDSYGTGQPVIVADIAAADAAVRWPRFSAAAREMGFAAVHAIPMRLRDQVIGTLNLFGTAPDGLDPAVAQAARAAFVLLRAYSRNNNYPLTQLAGDVISGTSGIIAGGHAKARPAERGQPAGR